jgi:DtxR family transcriptional regulator, Mn-dependent transcriptional regulator
MSSLLTITEENYLKAIFKLSEKNPRNISTNNIAAEVHTAAASVSDMIRKLSEKKLVHYKKYHGVELTEKGRKVALGLIRRHRLWEVFLVEKLHFNWDQVHEVAEEMEHVSSPLLITRLDKFLGSPKFDPHGDPIPDEHGKIVYHEETTLDQLQPKDKAMLVSVADQSSAFLQYLDKHQLTIKNKFEVLEHNEYDNSKTILLNNNRLFISEKVGKNLVVKKI